MSNRRKLTPLATALILVDSLSPEEQATLADYLRGKQAPKEVKPRQKRKPVETVGEQPKAGGNPFNKPLCVICGNEEGFKDHKEDSDDYHIFRTELKEGKKGGKAAKNLLPDNPEDFHAGATALTGLGKSEPNAA